MVAAEGEKETAVVVGMLCMKSGSYGTYPPALPLARDMVLG